MTALSLNDFAEPSTHYSGLDLVVEGVLWTIVLTALAVGYAALREAREGTPAQDLADVFS